MRSLGLGGVTSDPLKLHVDLASAPDKNALCERLLTKLSLSQLNTLHSYMDKPASKKGIAFLDGDSYEGSVVVTPLDTSRRQSVKDDGLGGLSALQQQQKMAAATEHHLCTLDEFLSAYHKTLNSASISKYRDLIDARLEALFHRFDTNQDGRISFADLSIVKPILARQEDMSDSSDVSGSEGDDELGTARSDRQHHHHHHARDTEITIYNEVAFSVEWSAFASNVLGGEVPEWQDCSYLKYHVGIHKFTLTWRNSLIMFDMSLTDEGQYRANPSALLQGHVSPVITALHVPHLKRLFSSGTDRHIVTWIEGEGWGKGEKASVGCAQVSMVYDPSSQFLFTGGTDGAIYLYPTIPRFGQPIKRIQAHTGWVNDLIIIPDLDSLVSCSGDSTVKFFSTASLELRTTKSSPQYTSGLNRMQYSKRHRAIYTSISGREVLLWSPFLPKPTETLQSHDKPIVGMACFDKSPEVMTVDLSGKIAIWDMRMTRVVQVLGSPDSPSPIGTTHSVAYGTHQHHILCLGDRSMSLFVPQKGSCSALMDSQVSQVLMDPVSKSILCSCGGKVVVFELTTGEFRHSHSFGGIEITAMACAVQQQLLIGTEEGKVIAVQIGSWRQSVNMSHKDPIWLISDLGKKSRLSATGESPKGVAVTSNGCVIVFPYGEIAQTLMEPSMIVTTHFSALECAAFSLKFSTLFMSRRQFFEAWDILNQTRKTVQNVPGAITAMESVDELDAVLLGTVDRAVYCLQTLTCVLIFVIKLNGPPKIIPPHTTTFVLTEEGSIPLRFAFDRMSWTLSVMGSGFVKMFALDDVMRRIRQYHHHSSITFGSSTRAIHRGRYLVDTTALCFEPCTMYQVRSKFHTMLVLTLLVCQGRGVDVSGEDQQMLRDVSRVTDTQTMLTTRMQRLMDWKTASGEAQITPYVQLPVDFFVPTNVDKLDNQLRSSLLYVVYRNIPHHRRAIPTEHFAYQIEVSRKQRLQKEISTKPGSGAVGDSNSKTIGGGERREDENSNLVAELKWMVVCIAVGLSKLHAKHHVSLFSAEMVRFMDPFYVMVLENGIWLQGEVATGCLGAHLTPPEGLESVSTAVDMWLLGLMVYKLMVGHELFTETHRCEASVFDASLPNLVGIDSKIDVAVRDGLLVKLVKRLLCPQPSRRATVDEVLSLLDGASHPPRHLLCVPMAATESRHSLFVLAEEEASMRASVHPCLEGGEFNCVAMCQIPTLAIVVEFNGQSAHLTLWGESGKLIGVSPPNSAVGAMYTVSREEISNTRFAAAAEDGDETLSTKRKVKVERFCPFFTEHQAVDGEEGKVSEPLPTPYYLEGWHRLRTLDLSKTNSSQKQRDAVLRKRWEEAAASASTHSFEKLLFTANERFSEEMLGFVSESHDDSDVEQSQGVQRSPQSKNSSPAKKKGNILSDDEHPVTAGPKVSAKLDGFLFSRELNPHWGKPLVKVEPVRAGRVPSGLGFRPRSSSSVVLPRVTTGKTSKGGAK